MLLAESPLFIGITDQAVDAEHAATVQRRPPIARRQIARPRCWPRLTFGIDNFGGKEDVADFVLFLKSASEAGRNDELGAVRYFFQHRLR